MSLEQGGGLGEGGGYWGRRAARRPVSLEQGGGLGEGGGILGPEGH